MRRLVTQAEFAEIVGIGRSGVNLAIRDGRLRASVVIAPSGRRMLDLDGALAEWHAHTNPDQSERARWPRR